MAEVGEGAPAKQSVVSRFINRLKGRPAPQPQISEGLAGTRTEKQIKAAYQKYPKPQQEPETTAEQPAQPVGVTPLEPTTEAREAMKTFSGEIIPPSEQPPPGGYASRRQREYKKAQALSKKSPEQLAEEARIDAENLAKLQQPPGPLPKIPPFTEETSLPEKVFEPQPEVPGEHKEVEEFLETKPQPAAETPQPPTETPQTTKPDTSLAHKILETPPAGEHEEVESFLKTKTKTPQEQTHAETGPVSKQPIPTDIPPKTQAPISVGAAEPVGEETR